MSVDMIAFLKGWAQQWADQRGGASNYDWDGTNPVFSKYAQNYGVDLDWSMGDYAIQSKVPSQFSAKTETYGPFKLPSTFSFGYNHSETDSFDWSVTDTISVTQSTSISVGVPDLFTADASLTFDLSLSSTQAQQKQRSNTWDLTRIFDLPADTISTMELMVVQTTAKATSDLSGLMRGRIAIGLNNKWNGHYFWFVTVTSLAREFNDRNDIRVVGDAVEVRVPVNFTGVGVTDVYIREKATDANGRSTVRVHDGLRQADALSEAA